jgi:hypothetical protein
MNLLERIFHFHEWYEDKSYKDANGNWWTIDKCKICGLENERPYLPWYCKGGDWF